MREIFSLRTPVVVVCVSTKSSGVVDAVKGKVTRWWR